MVIGLNSGMNNAKQLDCQYRFAPRRYRSGNVKEPTLCASHGWSLARSPDDPLVVWTRLDVSELVQTHAGMDGTTQSSSSTTTYSPLTFGCIVGSRTTHLIMNANDDSDCLALPATALAHHLTKAWPRSRPLGPQETSSRPAGVATWTAGSRFFQQYKRKGNSRRALPDVDVV